MKNIIYDFKVIATIIVFSLIYSVVLRERYNISDILNIIDRVIIFSFCIYILSNIVIYKFQYKYTNNLYRYLLGCFFSIGLLEYLSICFLQKSYINKSFETSCLIIQIFLYIIGTYFMIYCFLNYKTKNDYIKFFKITLAVAITTILLASASNYLQLNIFDNSDAKIIILELYLIGIDLKVYLMKIIKDNRNDIDENLYIYLCMFIFCGIVCMSIDILFHLKVPVNFMILSYILRVFSSYCIIRIVISGIIMDSNKRMSMDFNNKSDELEATALELKKTIEDKDILYHNYIKKKKQDEIKNEILTNISHEFKTPVNVIYSAVQTQELLKENRNINEVAKYNNIIKQNCNRLIRLINNFIDITRFDKKNINGEFICENIVEITEYLTMCVVEFAESKKISLIFDTSDEELYALVDKQLYDRLILNLLSNAIKYSRNNGHINVEVKDIGEFIQISVEDDGIGIDQYHLKDIFRRFERVDKSYSRNTEGCGLGLNIVKKIVEIHNGSIDIESRKEIGTRVVVKLHKLENGYKDEMCRRLEDKTYVKYEVEVEMSDIY